jgi:hypothetical protein
VETASQLACCDPHWIRLQGADPLPIVRRLHHTGLVLASFDLPPDLTRADAAERIRSGFASLLREMMPPGTLLMVCSSVQVSTSLEVSVLGAEGFIATVVSRDSVTPTYYSDKCPPTPRPTQP